ncbi:MAG TPA: hypothetical protein VKA50_12650 [Gammaproteobacteria bacterium]|nr:hypothetical protein [Gammaproteobacteria bacterium]
MAKGMRERMAAEAAAWRHEGLIDDDLAGLLEGRYAPMPGVGRMFLRALALLALFLLALSVLSAIGLLVQSASPALGGVMVVALGIASWYPGARMASDPAHRHAFTGSVLLTFGLVAVYAGMSIIYLASGGNRYSDVFPWFMLLTSAGAFATAYRFGLRWPLFLGLILLFHAVGSRHAYVGHGGYFLHIQDERTMAVVALVACVFGVWHELVGEVGRLRRQVGFGHLYIIFGLLYFNVSLWILSLHRAALAWVLVFTAAAIAQIVTGARLKDARFTGFGIVFLAIDLYTRLFEHFWDRLSSGVFFLAAGLIAVVLGVAFERRSRAKTS